MPLPLTAKRSRQGFTLLEIAIVLLIMGLLLTITGTTTAAYLNQKRRAETQEKMKVIDTAIVNFVALNRRLPCPADGTINAAAGAANAGKENCALATGTQANGVVPFTDLGLSLTDGSDSWGNLFTYRVDPNSYQANAMDLTYCTAAGTSAFLVTATTSCDTTCTSGTFPAACTKTSNSVLNRGLLVKNIGPPQVTIADPAQSTGAAYVLISHGENLEGAYSQAGVLIAAGTITSGTEEQKNFANAAYSYLVDDNANYNAGASHFDDFVSRPSLLTVASKATLGPRPY